jgi:hypothetical protein
VAGHRPAFGFYDERVRTSALLGEFMSRYYFHRRANGELARDRRGRQFESHDAACDHAVRRTPSILGKLIQSTTNTYLTTEVTDGERSLFVVRGTVIIELT